MDIGANKMRRLAEMLKKEMPGTGFALLVFNFNDPGMANYIGNAKREDIIKAFRSTSDRLDKRQDIQTPEEN